MLLLGTISRVISSYNNELTRANITGSARLFDLKGNFDYTVYCKENQRGFDFLILLSEHIITDKLFIKV